MAELAVRATGLSKLYRIGERQTSKSLRESLVHLARRPLRWRRTPVPTIWALRDVALEVPCGQVVGIIGRNGAGKSTLLKILSRITEPTAGRVELRGRVASLLEVGTGFHQELTGRENIFLNGAILGMGREEIRRKFDEIVAFAEIERFIDTPVKRYSSGMYLRLAFAVAAHLEPEILLVDEVLAVGDLAFQKRCLGKMDEVGKQGRTVLFVSHNMAAVQRLCSVTHLFDGGRLVASGATSEVIDAYYRSDGRESAARAPGDEVPAGAVRITGWSLGSSASNEPATCYANEPWRMVLRVRSRRPLAGGHFGIAMWAHDGTLVWAMRSLDDGRGSLAIPAGLYDVEFSLPTLPVRPGTYQIVASVNDTREGGLDECHAQVQVIPRHETGLPPRWQGVLSLPGEFRLSPVDEPGSAPVGGS